MKLLEDLKKSLAKVHDFRGQIGAIMLNEKDLHEIRGYAEEYQFGSDMLSSNDRTLFGNKMIVIPIYLYDPNFLKIGKTIIIGKNYFEFLKGALNG